MQTRTKAVRCRNHEELPTSKAGPAEFAHSFEKSETHGHEHNFEDAYKQIVQMQNKDFKISNSEAGTVSLWKFCRKC
jgi:hypothetical protein